MNNQPVLTTATLAGIGVAAWNVVVAQGILEMLRPDAQTALTALVNLVIPIVAALIARHYTTPVAAPNGIAPGTLVNANSPEPSVVVPQA